MRYAIISDIHSNQQALEAAFSRIEIEKVDSIICLGDVVGYNANPIECIKLIQGNSKVSYRIMGNHDAAAAKGVKNFSYSEIQDWSTDALNGLQLSDSLIGDTERQWLTFPPESLIIEDPKIKFFISHHSPCGQGFNYGYILSSWEANDAIRCLKAKNINIGFFGHTHLPTVIINKKNKKKSLFDMGKHICGDTIKIEPDSYYLINPGAIGQPRGDGFTSFSIFDTEKMTIDMNSFEYNIEEAQNAIIKAVYADTRANARLAKRLGKK